MSGMVSGILGGAAGMIGGTVAGLRGTPDQRTFDTTTTTRQVEDIMSTEERAKAERDLFEAGLRDIGAARDQATSLESRIGEMSPLEQASMDQYLNIVGGQAFNVTPEEQALIDQQRQQQIQSGEADINEFLDQRLQGIVQSAGGRGLRGQALGELQGNALKEASRAQQSLVGQANAAALSRQQNLPFQRISSQQPFLNQGFSAGDVLRQQAIANRMTLSNPSLLSNLYNERMNRAGTTSQIEHLTPGTPGGNFWDGLMGATTGGVQGMQLAGGGTSGGGGGGATGNGSGGGGATTMSGGNASQMGDYGGNGGSAGGGAAMGLATGGYGGFA